MFIFSKLLFLLGNIINLIKSRESMNNSFLQNNSRYVPFSQHWLHHVACGCLVMAMMVSPVIVSAQNATGGG